MIPVTVGTTARRAAVIFLGCIALAPAVHGQASFRPRFLAHPPFSLPLGFDFGRQAVTLADVNDDQRPDLVAIAPDDEQVVVRLNDGHGAFGAPAVFDLSLTPTAVAVADVASPFGSSAAGAPDGVVDLLVGGDAGELQILPGLGSGSFGVSEDVLEFDDTVEILGLVVGNFDARPGADVALLDDFGVLVLCNDSGLLGPCSGNGLIEFGDDLIEIASGDFNGDAHADLAVLDRSVQRIWPLSSKGDGTFTIGNAANVAGEANDGESVDMAVARMDDDGIDDLVVVNYSDDLQFLGVVLLGTTRGTFRTLAFVADFEASALAVADFDDDGANDAIAGYLDRGVTVNIGDVSGSLMDPFTPVGTATVGPVGLALAGDLNNDGVADLVIVDGDGGFARVLINGTLPFCAGDCNANGVVSIDEIMRGVNILLGESDPRDCIAMDVDDNFAVTVNELVAAVKSDLEGCPVN